MIDVNLLRSQGFLHLDAIPAAARGKFIESIESKKNGGTYSENIELGLSVLAEMGLSIEFLVKLHREVFYEPADPDSFYFIVRKVESGQSREAFRSHFDSHRFTIVVPLRVPNVGGELFHSSVRKEPRNALSNLAGKIFWKLFASRLGYKVVNLFSKIIGHCCFLVDPLCTETFSITMVPNLVLACFYTSSIRKKEKVSAD
jgi:hypothetical protein